MQVMFDSGESISLDFCGDHLIGTIGGHRVKWDLDGQVINKDELPDWVIEIAETLKI